MNVVPLWPNVRYYCSACDERFYEYEREKHEHCIEHVYCVGCGRAFAPGEEDCPMCGAPAPKPLAEAG